jgi:hypothetical protein
MFVFSLDQFYIHVNNFQPPSHSHENRDAKSDDSRLRSRMINNDQLGGSLLGKEGS